MFSVIDLLVRHHPASFLIRGHPGYQVEALEESERLSRRKCEYQAEPDAASWKVGHVAAAVVMLLAICGLLFQVTGAPNTTASPLVAASDATGR